VEAVTKATGIKALVDWFSEETGIDCGCEKRKEALNKITLFHRFKPNCLNQTQYDILKGILPEVIKTNKVTPAQQDAIWDIYEAVMPHRPYKVKPSCQKCWVDIYHQVNAIYNAYKQ
jgi:hypothetical protein